MKNLTLSWRTACARPQSARITAALALPEQGSRWTLANRSIVIISHQHPGRWSGTRTGGFCRLVEIGLKSKNERAQHVATGTTTGRRFSSTISSAP